MPGSSEELLHGWHDFYILVGTASATLVGLMFVAASIGAHFFNEQHSAPMRAFISPTVVHFSATLFACLVAVMPDQSRPLLAGLVGAGGLAGLIYGGRIVTDIAIRRRYDVDLTDRLFYALLPMLGYLAVLLAAALLFLRSAAGAEVLAAGLLLLLAAGIRNAWDMTLWIMVRTSAAQESAASAATTAVPEPSSPPAPQSSPGQDGSSEPSTA